jgi:hypothetical protein
MGGGGGRRRGGEEEKIGCRSTVRVFIIESPDLPDLQPRVFLHAADKRSISSCRPLVLSHSFPVLLTSYCYMSMVFRNSSQSRKCSLQPNIFIYV